MSAKGRAKSATSALVAQPQPPDFVPLVPVEPPLAPALPFELPPLPVEPEPLAP